MRLHEHHKSSLFIIEMIISIFVLAFSAAACTHIFSLAQGLRSDARAYNDCQTLFTNICEELNATPHSTNPPSETIESQAFYDSDLLPTKEDDKYSYKTIIQTEYKDLLACSEISIYQVKNQTETLLLQEEFHSWGNTPQEVS